MCVRGLSWAFAIRPTLPVKLAQSERALCTEITKQAKAVGGNAALSAPILKHISHLSGRHCNPYMHTCRNCLCVCVLARALKNGSIITKSDVRPQLSRTVHKLINFSPTYYIIWFLFSSQFFCYALYIYLFYDTRIFRSFQRELYVSLFKSVCFRF